MIETGPVTTGDQLRRAFGCFPSGVTAVCTLVNWTPIGSSVLPLRVEGPRRDPVTPALVFHNSRLRRLSAA